MPVRPVIVLSLIVLLATWLRVEEAAARGDLWLDEWFDLRHATGDTSFLELVRATTEEGHPPLHYLTERAVFRVFGEEALRSRAHVIVCGVASVVGVALLGARWFGWTCGLLAAFVAAASPFLVRYSAELRVYGLFGLLSIAHMMVYLEYRVRRTWGWTVAWGVLSGLLVLTHALGALIVVSTGVLALRDRAWSRIVGAGLLGGGLVALWLPFLWQRPTDTHGIFGAASYDPMLILGPMQQVAERTARAVLWVSLLAGAWLVRRHARSPREPFAYHTITLAALGAGTLFWLGQMRFFPNSPRYVIGLALVLLPPACHFLARLLEQRAWKPAALGYAGVGLLAFSLWYDARGDRRKPVVLHSRFARSMESRERPDDLFVPSPGYLRWTFGEVYRGALDVDRRTPDELRAQLRAGGRIWLYVARRRGYAAPPDALDAGPEHERPLSMQRRTEHAALAAVLREKAVLLDREETTWADCRHPTVLLLYGPKEER